MIPETFNDLDALHGWVLNSLPGLALIPPMDSSISFLSSNATIVVFRQGRFQVELVISAPNSEIADHQHPTIDSYEVYLTGDINFRHGGVQVTEFNEHGSPLENRFHAHPLLSSSIRVRPHDWHGATIGPRGGSFLSVQHWLGDGKMGGVVDSWDGPLLDELHGKRIAGIR